MTPWISSCAEVVRVEQLGEARDRRALLAGRPEGRQRDPRGPLAPHSRVCSTSAPACTARRITASVKPASTASLRRSSPSSATCATSACGLLPLDRRRARAQHADRGRADARLGEHAPPLERARADQRVDGAEQRGGRRAARLGVAQQHGGRHPVAEIVPEQPDQALGDVWEAGRRRAAAPRGTSRSTARGTAAASTTAPSASRSEQR